ncbi:MAG: hypothetical protein ABWX94_02500 [Candidatus Saccharimonadales bacterium]
MSAQEFNTNPPDYITRETVAPHDRELGDRETLIIENFAADPDRATHPLLGADGEEVFSHACATVQVRVGGTKDYELIEINDVSKSPWYETDAEGDQTGRRGNFVAVRHTPRGDGTFRTASVHAIQPGRWLGIGRDQLIGDQNQPDTVSRDHAAIAINANGKLIVANHNPRNTTRIRNLNVTAMPTASLPMTPESGPNTKLDPGEFAAAIDPVTGKVTTVIHQEPKMIPARQATRREQLRRRQLPVTHLGSASLQRYRTY